MVNKIHVHVKSIMITLLGNVSEKKGVSFDRKGELYCLHVTIKTFRERDIHEDIYLSAIEKINVQPSSRPTFHRCRTRQRRPSPTLCPCPAALSEQLRPSDQAPSPAAIYSQHRYARHTRRTSSDPQRYPQSSPCKASERQRYETGENGRGSDSSSDGSFVAGRYAAEDEILEGYLVVRADDLVALSMEHQK